ncbi:MAG: transposase [Actinobacteria bacterium]|nr:transposase [Actinomycetota bacterium]
MWVDSTETASYSDAKHACGPEDDCEYHGRARQPRLRKFTAEVAADHRRREGAVEEKATRAVATSPSQPGLRPIPPEGTTERDGAGIRYVASGHWRRSHDPDARTRMYTDRDCWHGYYNGKVVDMMTGATVSVRVTPTDKNESVTFGSLYDSAKAVIGTAPIALCADRGYAFDNVHEMLLSDDVTPVIQYRKRSGHSPERAEETAEVDRHGIPKCQSCARPGNQVRFSSKGDPRVWFTCSSKTTPGCHKEQVTPCRSAKRRLLPIPRTNIIYAALRDSMQSFERSHHITRLRFSSGMKSDTKRPRGVGLGWQQLRASAGSFVQWLWVLMNLKWLDGGTHPANAVAKTTSTYQGRVLTARRNELIPGGGSPRMRKWHGVRTGAPPPTTP